MEAHHIKKDFEKTFTECDTFSNQTLMMTDSPLGDGARHGQPAPTPVVVGSRVHGGRIGAGGCNS